MDFLDFLEPEARAAYRSAAYARQAQNDPDYAIGTGMAPEEETSWLGRRLDESLGGISYLGKLADKTFGGRALRGVLGGRPQEALSLLPFSDTLGVTKESDTVQGTDLLADLGLVTKGDNDWTNQLAGLGTEIALDPSTYLGIGPLTKAGKATAAAGGKLAPRLSERIAAGQAGLLSFGLPFAEKSILGTGDTSAAIARNFWKPVTTPATAAALGAEKYLGGPIERLTGTNPISLAGSVADAGYRQLRSMFDTRVASATSRAGQDVGQVVTDAYKGLARPANERFADQVVDLDPLLKLSPDAARSAQEGLTHAAEYPAGPISQMVGSAGERLGQEMEQESAKLLQFRKKFEAQGLDPDVVNTNLREMQSLTHTSSDYARMSGADARWAPFFTAEQQQMLGKHAADASDAMKAMNRVEAAKGIKAPDLFDILDYYPRQKAHVEQQPGEGFWRYVKRATADFNARSDFQARRLEPFHDIPGGTVQLNELIKDPRFSGPARTMKDNPLAVQDELAKAITGTGIDAQVRGGLVEKKVKELAETLANMDPIYAKEGRDFFDMNFAEQGLRRGEAHARNMAAAEGAYYGIAKYAKPAAEMPDGAKVVDLLDAMSLNARGENALPVSWQILTDKMGLKNLDDVKDLRVPHDLAADLTRMGQAWRDPAMLKPILGAWDFLQNIFKAGVTTIFPAFHARNIASGLFNMFRDNALSANFREVREANGLIRGQMLGKETVQKLYPGATPEQGTKLFLKELVAGKVSLARGTRRINEVAGPVAEDLSYKLPDFANPQSFGGRAKEIGSEILPSGENKGVQAAWKEYVSPFGVAGAGAKEDTNRLVKTGRAVGQEIEDTIRSGHYLAKRLEGLSPVQAVDQVNKYHINYSRATPFERGVMRRLYPWYSFSAGNLPPVLEDLVAQPGKITAATRLVGGTRDPSQFVPSFIGEGASIPIPGAPEGQQRYISSFGLPLEDELLKTIGSGLRGDVPRFFQQGIGMANPLVKLPFEQAFNKQLFSGRSLDQLQPSTLVSLGGALPDDLARGLTEIVANSPASRAVHTVDTLLDTRKSLGSTLVNLASGVRLSDVDTARQQDLAARELVKTALRGSAEAKVREEVYVPIDKRGQLDPNERFLMELLKSTNQRVVDRTNQEKMLKGGY